MLPILSAILFAGLGSGAAIEIRQTTQSSVPDYFETTTDAYPGTRSVHDILPY